MKNYDVAVCGGGFAGISAALAAAREGKKGIQIKMRSFPPLQQPRRFV